MMYNNSRNVISQMTQVVHYIHAEQKIPVMAKDAVIFCDSSSASGVSEGLWSRTEVSELPSGVLCSKRDALDYKTVTKGAMFQRPSVPGSEGPPRCSLTVCFFQRRLVLTIYT